MSYNLYIDDIRNPPNRKYVVVRSFEAAKAYIAEFGMPRFVSFDHDLGMMGKTLPSGIWIGEEVEAATGYDFAKWLCEQDMDSPWMSSLGFSFHVHSANPVGKANIEGYLNNYLNHIGM